MDKNQAVAVFIERLLHHGVERETIAEAVHDVTALRLASAVEAVDSPDWPYTFAHEHARRLCWRP